jgi:RNA polymerase sigma-70 factor (ECF subfamily)
VTLPVQRGSDDELVDRLAAGDESAFANAVAMWHGSLVRLARLFVSTRASAEEVAQETWTAALEGLPSFERRSSFKTWLFRILVNRARTRGGREGRVIPISSLAAAGDEPAVDPSRFGDDRHWTDEGVPKPWHDDTPEKLALRRESMDLLGRVVAELPEGQRAVLLLRDVEGFSTEEACALLDISEGNGRVLLHRARSRVRGALESYLEKAS